VAGVSQVCQANQSVGIFGVGGVATDGDYDVRIVGKYRVITLS
jgi:hypothetical protein